MIPVKILLTSFADLLACYWEGLSSLSTFDSSGSLQADWLQANWELIVEGLIEEHGLVLEPYGDGADCNGASSRVLYPDRLPTHKLICKPLNGGSIRNFLNDRQLDSTKSLIVFDRFVSIGQDGWYRECPPFDKVLADCDGEDVVLDFTSIDIVLHKKT